MHEEMKGSSQEPLSNSGLPKTREHNRVYAMPLRVRQEDLERIALVVKGCTTPNTLREFDPPLRRAACHFSSAYDRVREKIHEVFHDRGELTVGTSRDAMHRYEILRHLLGHGDSYDQLFAALAISQKILSPLLDRPTEALKGETPELADEIKQIREDIKRVWKTLDQSVLDAVAAVTNGSDTKNQ